jgi:AAT family amino acid transporter
MLLDEKWMYAIITGLVWVTLLSVAYGWMNIRKRKQEQAPS